MVKLNMAVAKASKTRNNKNNMANYEHYLMGGALKYTAIFNLTDTVKTSNEFNAWLIDWWF